MKLRCILENGFAIIYRYAFVFITCMKIAGRFDLWLVIINRKPIKEDYIHKLIVSLLRGRWSSSKQIVPVYDYYIY